MGKKKTKSASVAAASSDTVSSVPKATTRSNSATKVKEAANELHKQAKFQEAIKLYTEAIELDPSEPVFLGNRSASYFETGQYRESAKDSIEAFTRLNNVKSQDAKTKALTERLRTRAISAMLLCRDMTMLKSFSDQLTEKETELVANVRKQRHLRGLVQAATSCVVKPYRAEPHKIMPLLSNRDIAESFLAGLATIPDLMKKSQIGILQEDVDSRINMASPDGPVSFLDASCGDGRASFLTILDYFAQRKQNSNLKTPMMLVLNDLNPTALARLVLLLHEIRKLDAYGKYNRKDGRFSYLITQITMMHCGIGIPTNVRNDIRKAISLCASSIEYIKQSIPMISFLDDGTAERVHQVFCLWRDKTDSLTLGVAQTLYGDTYTPEKMEFIMGVGAANVTTEYNCELSREALAEYVKTIPEEQITSLISGRASLAEKRKYMVDEAMSKFSPAQLHKELSGPGRFRNTEADTRYMDNFGAMLPPLDFAGLKKIVMSPLKYTLFDAVKNERETNAKKVDMDLQKLTPSFILKSYSANPTVADLSWLQCPGDKKGKFLQSFKNRCDVQSLYTMEYVQLPNAPADIYDYYGQIFWKLSRLFVTYPNDVKITIANVPLNLIAKFVGEREEGNYFNRVALGGMANIYGVLTTLLTLAPLMAEDGKSTIKHTVGPCSSKCDNYQEYIFTTTTMRSAEESLELLGFKQLGGHILMVDKQPRWAFVSKQEYVIPSRSKLLSFLHRLLLNICYPVRRPVDTLNNLELSPMTINVFFMVVHRLAHLGVPPHWLSLLISDILASHKLSTTASVPVTSPNKLSLSLSAPDSELIDAFHSEFAALAALWASQRDFVPVTCSLPLDVTRFGIPFKDLVPKNDKSDVDAPSIVILICDEKLVFENKGKSETYRYYYDLVRFSTEKRHLFSAIEIVDGVVVFTCSRSIINSIKYEPWSAVMLRQDSWTMVAQPVEMLKCQEYL